MKKKVKIEFEVNIPKGTSEDVVKELATVLIPSKSALEFYELLYDKVYKMAESVKSPIISIEDYGNYKIDDIEKFFYNDHRKEFNKKYGYDDYEE